VKDNQAADGGEAGCQSEIGLACAMAAAGLAAALGATPRQVLAAAALGLDQHLGLRCDAVDGLVHTPCVERCGSAAVAAIEVARTSLSSIQERPLSFDDAIARMRDHGARVRSEATAAIGIRPLMPGASAAC
jgi:L-serine dehydratase